MKIIVDFQESRNCLIEYLREELEVEVKKLKVGDFIISKDVVVERKTVDDFVNSLIDRRLFKQADNMQKELLLTHGSDNNYNQNAYSFSCTTQEYEY